MAATTQEIVRFSERELMQRTERAAIAQAAKAKAEVEARYSMAMLNRRDMDDVRQRVLHECGRYEFAMAARYKVPNRGEGFTIRFAEAVAAHLGNIYVSAPVIVEDDDQRTICVTVMDLERNLTWTKDVVIIKTVERKSADGREVVRYRQKADGGSIAIVRATDEELLTKENSLVSKAARTGIERVIPPDLKVECLQRIKETLNNRDKDDPDAVRKSIADGFADLGVMPKDLKEYLGCELSALQPAEFPALRELYMGIKDGHTTWRDVMAQKRGDQQGDGDNPKDSSLKDKVKKATAKPEPVRVYDGFDDPNVPDPMNVPVGHKIYVKLPDGATKLYACNATQSGWLEVIADKA